MNVLRINLFLLINCTIGVSFISAKKQKKPNIIIIISDDQGWNDVGFNGCKDIPTPNLDALAEDGVRFSQAYASHPYSSPSRAGLLTGRYQHRFGHENNIPYHDATEKDGLPLDELMLSELLKENGYQTCAIGKWHLGEHRHFWPDKRGFTDWYGFVGGSRTFWTHGVRNPELNAIKRDGTDVPLDEITYLTDDFTEEAVKYIDQYHEKNQPYFMYLAYNAPHAPIHATRQYIDMVSHIEDGKRAAYAAMVVGMDCGIGKIIEKLKETGTYENTLIFFYSDNGGDEKFGSSNYPFRGSKGMMFEGGIRVPFLAIWPAGINGEQEFSKPITALDIYPTILEATGIKYTGENELDGVSLLPHVNGKSKRKPHDILFWRYSDGAGYAVRKGKYKLVYSGLKEKKILFDMENDPYEQDDLSAQMPEKTKELQSDYDKWNEKTIPAIWYDPHAENISITESIRQKFLDNVSAGEKKNKAVTDEKYINTKK